MDELKRRIKEYLDQWCPKREITYYEIYTIAMCVADGIARELCPRATFHSVYIAAKGAADEFIFGKGK